IRSEQQFHTFGARIDVADAAPMLDAVEIAVTLPQHPAHGEREDAVDQRTGQIGFATDVVEVSCAGFHLAFPMELAARRLRLERTARAVAAVQGTLWPAQHL